MASFRRKYQGVENKDAPPVTTMPNETAASPPPAVADAPKPPEPPVAEPSPADEAAKEKIALQLRLQEMERAEAITREAVSHPQFAEPQEPQQPTTEEIIAASGLPERAKAWLRQYPEYVSDPIKNAQMQKMHNLAEYQAGSEFTERYFDRMEILLGLRQEAPPSGNGQVHDRSVTNSVAASDRVPPRRAPAGPPVSAPPTREPPSMATGKSRNFRAPLNADELYIAQQSGQTPEQYQQEKEKLRRLKESGAIQ
jgi:hypothetical protein